MVGAASHDTACVIAGTPLDPTRPAIDISCGTWALVGCERRSPVVTPEAFAANITNDVGIEGTTRLLRNVTGLGLFEECRRQWWAEGIATELGALVATAAAVPGRCSVIDPDYARFAPTGAVATRGAEACREHGQPVPRMPADIARVWVRQSSSPP